MAKKKRRAKRKRNRGPRGITKKQYAKLLAQIRRRKNPKRRRPRIARATAAEIQAAEIGDYFRKLGKARKAKRKTQRKTVNPGVRKGKTGRWYKGPRGVKVRVRRSKGKFVVDLKR